MNKLLRPIGSHDTLYWKDVVGVLRNLVATTDEVSEFEEVISTLHMDVWEFFLNGSEDEIAKITQVTNAGFLKENACSKDAYEILLDIYDRGGEVLNAKNLRILRFHPVTVGGENTDIDCEQSNIRDFLDSAGIHYEASAKPGDLCDLAQVPGKKGEQYIKQWYQAFNIFRKLGLRYAKPQNPEKNVLISFHYLVTTCLKEGQVMRSSVYPSATAGFVEFFLSDARGEWRRRH